jgi:diguanylate cyclase (GGDEF)-like protein
VHDNKFHSLELGKYSRLFYCMVPAARGFAICDAKGMPQLLSNVGAKDAMQDAVSLLNSRPASLLDEDGNIRCRRLGGNRVLYAMSLILESLETYGIMAALVDLDGQEDGAGQVTAAMQNLALCLTNEYQLTGEVEAMAAELTERYEELNMIYETAEQVSGFAQGQEALRQLVLNCADYLNVNLAVLYMLGEKKPIYHISHRDPLPDSQNIIEQLFTLYPWTRKNNTSLVLNKRSASLRDKLFPALSHKIMSCPVINGDGEVDGVLSCVSTSEKRDFTNSDRNILEVMSKKASQIIASSYDSLTGLINRKGFEYHLERGLQSARYKGFTHSVLYIDLDQVHVINDTASHKVGDELIKRVGRLIKQQVREVDTLSRLNGDIFGVLLEKCPPEDGRSIARKIRDLIRQLDFEWDNLKFEVSACIGVAALTAERSSVESVLDDAEVACDAAKKLGKGRVTLFAQGDSDLTRRKSEMQWVNRIYRALRENRFEVYSQPIRPLQDGVEALHFEVLLRMRDENGEILSPFLFIPAAERYFLMPDIDRWVVRNTLAILADRWPDLQDLHGVWSINLSGQSIVDRNFLNDIIQQLRTSPVPGAAICFEITETATIGNLAEAQKFIAALKNEGCSFSLDDFGTGLSSFSYLKNLPVDYLKIDGSFVKEIVDDSSLAAMVEAINHIGHILNLKTIAEFVKDDDIVALLKRMRVDFGQGYALGRPEPLTEQLTALLVPATV